MTILANKNNILYHQASFSEWRRPQDWLPMPTNITSSQDGFAGLYAIFPEGQNYAAFTFTTSTGLYSVDWGDGTATSHSSNTMATRSYDFASISDSTLTSFGYKQSMITVTPVVSGSLRTCNFNQRIVTSPTQTQAYSTGFLDCILSMPSASTGASIVFGGTSVSHGNVERFEIKTIGNATSTVGLFRNCFSLKSVPLFNTANVTDMGNMFQNCYTIRTVPLFNTTNVTASSGFSAGMNDMFASCFSLETVPLFNTANVSLMTRMFQNCNSLKSVPSFNTGNVTNMNALFQNCFSLSSIPTFNTANVTNMSFMFINCTNLQSIPALSTAAITTSTGTDFTNFAAGAFPVDRIQMSFARTVNISGCQLSRTAIVEVFNNLVNRSSTTSANINVASNWGASALTTEDRSIATGKNWTITS